MTTDHSVGGSTPFSRRTLLKGAALGAAVLAAPHVVRAAGHQTVVRYSMTLDEGLAHMETYRRAVDVMLSLDPSNPHNWHRYALIHLMDCPHMNWWFFVWHRPYTAHFERIIRIYGEDDSFALPFWDWTKDSFVPATMLNSDKDPDNPLDPRSSMFPDWATFEDKFHDPVEALWNGFDDAQRLQLDTRGYPDFDSFWTGNERLGTGVKPNFTNDRTRARSKTFETPQLTDRGLNTVKYENYKAGLTTHNFVTTRQMVNGEPTTVGGLNTAQTLTHDGGSSFGSLVEGQPHNHVHNNLGYSTGPDYGWMPSLLSPVDPIFFMHHCNVDRLWDIWTRRQIVNGRSPYPAPGLQATIFNGEEFLFYVDAAGNPAPSTAGGSMDIEPSWGYSYADGTGSELVAPDGGTSTSFVAQSTARGQAPFDAQKAGAITLAVPGALAELVPEPASRQVAHIVITPPSMLRGVSFDIFVTPEGEAPDTSRESPEFAGSAEFFGMGHSHGHDLGFSVDITEALDRLHSQGILEPGGAFDVAVVMAVPEEADHADHDMGGGAILKSVSIETIVTG
ncbi:MAG: tyrosinase family protein [Paracoccaceae bacterium]|nr:tyrosinase family protein [Paracoccaceae bacterium]